MTVPFLLRFAQPMREAPLDPFDHDVLRGESQMPIDGGRVDAPDTSLATIPDTRLTEVKRETTDDE